MFLLISFIRAETVYEAYKSGAQCHICHSLHRQLREEKTAKNDLNPKDLMKHCNNYTDGSQKICQFLALDWFDHMREAENEDSACIFVCNPEKYEKPRRMRIKPLKTDWACDFCPIVVNIMIEIFRNEILPTIDSPIREACELIPMFQDRCFLFNSEKNSRIFDYIFQDNNLDPKDICTVYGVC